VCSLRITDPSQKENLGIVVQYKVKVRLLLGFGSRWVWYMFIAVELGKHYKILEEDGLYKVVLGDIRFRNPDSDT